MTHGPSTTNRYCRLALSLLGGIYFAVASFQVGAAQSVNVTVNPTTGYAEVGPRTYSLPSNARVTPGSGLPSVAATSGAGLRQSFPSGIEITALRDPAVKSSFGLGSGLSASAQAIKNAAVRCFTSLKCNLAFAAGAAGIETLFDGIDWVMTDGTVSRRVVDTVPAPGGPLWWAAPKSPTSQWLAPTPQGACDLYTASLGLPVRNVRGYTTSATEGACAYDQWSSGGQYWVVVPPKLLKRTAGTCPSGTSYDQALGICSTGSSWVPASQSEIDQKIQADYTPHPTDWRFILPGLDLADDAVFIDVSPLPSPAATSLPSVQVNPDGSTSETTTSWDFDFLDNPGKQPIGQSTETTTKTDYSPTGQPTGTTTTTTTVVGSSPGSTPISEPPEIPTDCDFMPTVCAFLDWFKQPDPDSSDPYDDMKDLVQVYEDPGTTVAIGPFNAACPAPRTISLSFVPSVEVSFQPFCDLASAVRLWLLAIAYFGAAFVTVRAI